MGRIILVTGGATSGNRLGRKRALNRFQPIAVISPRRRRLVDCLRLWLSNKMLAADGDWRGALKGLAYALLRQTAPVVLVTNAVGSGIVPDNALARRFQDAAGVVNEAIGAIADEVVLVMAGQALVIKGGTV